MSLTQHKKVAIFSFLVILSILFVPTTLRAQIIPEINSVLVPTVVPADPGPREDVSIRIKSYSLDLNNATISWFINETLQSQGIGQTSFSFTTGNLGSASVVDIVVETAGEVKAEQVIIRPADLDLLWQAHSFTHPFYSGRALPAIGGLISVAAIPNFVDESGARIPSSELSYTWSVDGSVVERVSGRGRSTITASQTKPTDRLVVSVRAETPSGLLSKETRLVIPIVSPEIVLYENNPLLGPLFNTAITNTFSLRETETRFIAYPFFMSLSNRNDEHITYTWQLDNTPIELGDDRGSITVRQSGSEVGEAAIGVVVENTRDIFQKGNAAFSILFGASAPSFGL